MILASIFDQMNAIIYSLTKDGKSGRNRPESLARILTNNVNQGKDKEEKGFTSSKDFEAEREKLREEILKKGG